jgi:hypothetical protein
MAERLEEAKETIVRVRTERFTTGFALVGGIVVRVEPRLRFMLGWSADKAKGTIQRNGWRAGVLVDPSTDPGLVDAISETEAANEPPPLEIEPVAARTDLPPPTVEAWHLCHCGKFGSFGYDVKWLRGIPGIWYCYEHKPVEDENGEIIHGENAHIRQSSEPAFVGSGDDADA